MGGGALAAHLLRTDTNERTEVLELHGVLADRLPEALAEMEAVATGTRCKKSLYHASINTGPGEELTLEQKAAAVARLELALGLEGHARAVVEHRKEGRDHLHVVWSRIDVDTMRAAHDGHNYRKHEAVARELEREFGHKRVQGAHIERDGPEGDRKPRPPRTPSPGDVQQATRTKREIGDVGAELTRLWRAADTGPAFAAALEGAGYVLAQGDRRGYVIIDQAGGVHSLARRIEGAKTKDVNARLASIDLASLPTAAQARAMQRDREAVRESLAPPAEDRAANLAVEEARQDVARQQIRADIDQHLKDQAEKRHQGAKTGRGETEVSAALEAAPPKSERAQPPPDRRNGPNFQQQVADSAEYKQGQQESYHRGKADSDHRQEKAAADRFRVKPEPAKEVGRAAGKKAGGLLGLFGKLFGGFRGAADAATGSTTAPKKEQGPVPRPAPPPPERAARPAPVRTPTRPAPPRAPSVFDEIEREIRAAKSAAPNERPSQGKDRGGREMEFRPITRLIGALGQYVGWAIEAKKRLWAYGMRTGEDVSAGLRELDEIIYFAGHAPKPT